MTHKERKRSLISLFNTGPPALGWKQGMAVRHAQGGGILQMPVFMRADKVRGLEHLLTESCASYPPPPVLTHHKEKSHTKWTSALPLIFLPVLFLILSLFLPWHSPGSCLSEPWSFLSNDESNTKFILHIQNIPNSLRFQAQSNRKCFSPGRLHYLFFKNTSQISSASWICSWNITLSFMILSFSYFKSVFEACQNCLGYAAIPIQQMALVLSKHYGNLLYS